VVITVSGLASPLISWFYSGGLCGDKHGDRAAGDCLGYSLPTGECVGDHPFLPQGRGADYYPGAGHAKEPEQAANRTGSGGVIHDAQRLPPQHQHRRFLLPPQHRPP